MSSSRTALVVFAGIFGFMISASAIQAATAPSVDSVVEARSATGAGRILILNGRKLTKYTAYELFLEDGETPAGSLTLVSKNSKTVVLALPQALEPGGYKLLASGPKVPGNLLVLGIGAADAASTLGGQPASYFQNASNIGSGQLAPARFSAFDDLVDEAKIGSGAGQVAAGDHDHEALYAHRALAGAKVSLSANVSFTTPTTTPIAFDVEGVDPDDCWSAGQPARLTCSKSGYYLVVAKVSIADTNAGFDRLQILKNGSVAATQTANFGSTSIAPSYESTVLLHLASGDHVEMVSTIPDGAAPRTRTLKGGVGETELTMVKIGE